MIFKVALIISQLSRLRRTRSVVLREWLKEFAVSAWLDPEADGEQPCREHRWRGCNTQGELLTIDSRVELLPHYPGFLMQSGGSAWTPAIIAMAGFFALKTVELFDKIEWTFPQVVTEFSRICEVPMGRVLFGGWSNSRNSMQLGCVFSDEAAALDQENQDSGEVV